MDADRKHELEVLILDSHHIINQYEQTIQTSDRAEEKVRARRVIQEQWDHIARYLIEYRPLVGGQLPDHLAQIAAHFEPVEAARGGEQTRPAPAGLITLPLAAHARCDIVVDLSHHQDKWDRFTSALANLAQDTTWQFGVVRENLVDCFPDIDRASVLVLALPHHSLFTPEETDDLVDWVANGGGLFLLGNYAPLHHESNPNDVASRFGFHFEDNLIMPESKLGEGDCRVQTRSFRADLAVAICSLEMDAHPILQGVGDVAFLSSCGIHIDSDPEGHTQIVFKSPATSGVMIPEGKRDGPYGFMPAIDRWRLDRCAEAPVLVVTRYGKGKVAISGSLKIGTSLGNDDNVRLVRNILAWLAKPDGLL
ncbi:MAG: DUF4350 domain-containing protein [Anaerolineae bacterium]|nr:DUF4350 domain-containing protein [Anaerolineae bacterium]